MLITGSCHCGNLSYTLDWEPEPVTIPARACTCSFCSKHGAVWAACPTGRLRVTVRDPALVSHHAFGTRTARFHVCACCGVVPVVTSLIEGREYAVVNVNSFDKLDPARLERSAVSFDDESAAVRLERRRQRWIGAVEFSLPVA
jgi:hypothetical protein